jgi:NAD(P)-dependent dehydrogenase (short-subunit alcohol dehydrogenase family)
MSNLKRLEGKVALVTGASRGIGRGVAQVLAGEGASLVLTARTVSGLKETADSLPAGTEVLTVGADLTDEAQVESVFTKAMEKFGRLDLLINNAGIFDGAPLDECTVELWDKVITTNLRTPFLCTRAAFRIMKAQRGGRIINIGSISALRVRPYSAPYSTSKHAIWGLTQVTALEGREYGITCGVLHPGNTNVESLAPLWKQRGEAAMEVEDISQAVLAMATLPPHVNMLEAVVLPTAQAFLGRG